MVNQRRHRFELSYSFAPYCPECCVPINDGNGSITNGWLVCAQCAFRGGINKGVLEHAVADGRIARHLSVSRNIMAYTPRAPIHTPIPLVELIIASNECSLLA